MLSDPMLSVPIDFRSYPNYDPTPVMSGQPEMRPNSDMRTKGRRLY